MNISSLRSPARFRLILTGWAAAAVVAAGPVLAAAPPEGGSPPPSSLAPAPSATPTAVPTAPVPAAGQQQTSASELVANMRRALGTIARAQAGKASEPAFRTAKARAFGRALGAVVGPLGELGNALKAPDAKTFGAMARTGAALAALQVAFRYNGIEDDEVEEGFEKLSAAYNVFRRNYGRDLVAARSEAESALSPAQRSARDDLQKRGAALAKTLTALQSALKDNPAAAFEAGAMLKGLARLDRAPRNRRGLLEHLATAELLLGRRDGLGFYLGEVYRDDAKKFEAAAPEPFQAFREAFDRTLAAAFADENPAEVFARKAAYFEDLAVAGVTDAELPALLAGLNKIAVAAEGAAKPNPAADRAADAQINADDPDDDTSLEPANGDGDPASPESGND